MKMKPYPEYRDSGLPWLGNIPAHWNLQRCKYVFRDVDERSSTGEETHLSMSQKYGLVESSRIDDWRLQSESHKGGKLCQVGDLVLNRLKAHLGVFAYAKQAGVVSADYTVLRPISKGHVQFFEALFKTPVYITELKRLTKGIVEGFWRLYTEDFYNIRAFVPPKDEQAAALSYLSRQGTNIRRFIRNKQRLVELLQEQKQAIINHGVTRGINPDVRLKPSGTDWLGEVPEHWEVKRFKNVCRLQRGYDLSNDKFIDGEYPVYGSNGVIGYHNSFTTNAPCITVGRSGSVGEVNYVERDFWAHNTALYVIDNFNNNWRYLFYVLRNIDLKMLSEGSAVPTLNRNYIHQLYIAIPSVREQNQIDLNIQNKIKMIDVAINRAQSQIELIREYRTRLIADVVTGKVDVRDIPVEPIEEPKYIEEMGEHAEAGDQEMGQRSGA